MVYRKRRVRIAIFTGYLILVFLIVLRLVFQPMEHFEPSGLIARPTQIVEDGLFQLVSPTADFPGIVFGVLKIEDQIIAVSDQICVDIEQKPFWKPGDYWEGFENTPGVEISVNGVAITNIRRSSGGVLTLETNDAGEVIGAHSFYIESCFQTQDINPQKQSNTVLVSLVLNSITLYSGSWELILQQ
jgi:hypothetical protein